MNKKYKIISVESRKGGVGKTTAGLNLAKLLKENDYCVLFLDIDITGTNVSDGLDSPFWKEITHRVKIYENNEPQDANLLKMFNQNFMTGQVIPIHADDLNSSGNKYRPFNKNKINVIGSQIYSDESSKSDLFCDPRFLFDELHAMWFVEFLQEICKLFSKEFSESQKIAIILDNSPGYIGFAPVIHEWLTDIGPEIGKILTITSLDKQDLESCSNAIRNIEKKFSHKLNAADSYSKSKNDPEIKFDNEKIEFIFRLLEFDLVKNRFDRNSTDDVFNKDNLYFYIDQNNVEKFRDGDPEIQRLYLGFLVNRVLQEVKNEPKEYFDKIFTPNINYTHARNLLNISGSRRRPEYAMVSYDHQIESQFYEILSERQDMYSKEDIIYILDSFANLKYNTQSNFPNFSNEIFLSPDLMNSDKIILEMNKWIDQKQKSIDDAFNILYNSQFNSIITLIQREWLPKHIIDIFLENLTRITSRFGNNLIDSYNSLDYDIDKFTSELTEKYRNMEHEIKFKYYNFFSGKYDEEVNYSIDLDSYLILPFFNSIFALLVQSFPIMLWKSDDRHYLEDLLVLVVLAQFNRWSKIQKHHPEMTPSMFLANERSAPKDLLNSYKSIRRDKSFNVRSLNKIYVTFCQSQARLLDLDQDTEFLFFVMEQLVKYQSNYRIETVPNIRETVENVIVNKTISHIDGKKQFPMEISSALSMKEFEYVLQKIIEKWGI